MAIEDNSENIDSDEFLQWMIAVDDNKTSIEDLHKEFLREKRLVLLSVL
jgi:hypothetical protein